MTRAFHTTHNRTINTEPQIHAPVLVAGPLELGGVAMSRTHEAVLHLAPVLKRVGEEEERGRCGWSSVLVDFACDVSKPTPSTSPTLVCTT